MNMFALILAIASLVTGVCWVYDLRVKRPQRKAKAQGLKQTQPQISNKELKKVLEPSGVIGQLGSYFWVIFIVMVFRAFIIEPFRIPSGSMMPTLLAGDFIAVTKWSYGLRNPLTNAVWIETSQPQRGDVIVFKYPEDPNVDYIKRVIGLPGDIVVYKDKQLYILPADSQGDPIKIERTKIDEYVIQKMTYEERAEIYTENLMGLEHRIQISPQMASLEEYFYTQNGIERGIWRVPPDQYFAMGDNRDNSRDSRFWGFVPFENLVGKTIGIWLSLEFDDDVDSMLPSFIPSAVRFGRIGGLE